MANHLDKTLNSISDEYIDKIDGSSRFYIEVDIGAKGQKLGFEDIGRRYRRVLAVVPIKQAQRGMKVRIDGRTFINYGQLESGLAIPGHVVKKSKLSFRQYVPNDSMILNFS